MSRRRRLGWQGSKNSVHAEATSTPLSNFVLDPAEVIWSSGWFSADANASGVGNCSETRTGDAWRGNAITYLAGLQGRFEGGGERADIVPGTLTTPTKVRIRTGRCREQTEAIAYSLFIGIPEQEGTDRTREHVADAASGENQVEKLIPTSEGVCDLTRISGNLDGAGERIHIYPTSKRTTSAVAAPATERHRQHASDSIRWPSYDSSTST